jgi:hypothetical protein
MPLPRVQPIIPISGQEPLDGPTGSVLDRAVNGVRHRPGFAVTTRVSVAIELRHSCVAYCPSAPCVPKHLAGFFHALQRHFRSLGLVIDGLPDLGCRHCIAGKRQFTQDQFADVPTHASPAGFLGMGCRLGCGITSRNCQAEHFHRRLKPFLAGFDQPGFLGFLFAKRERDPSISFQRVQIRKSFLHWRRHRSSPLLAEVPLLRDRPRKRSFNRNVPAAAACRGYGDRLLVVCGIPESTIRHSRSARFQYLIFVTFLTE